MYYEMLEYKVLNTGVWDTVVLYKVQNVLG